MHNEINQMENENNADTSAQQSNIKAQTTEPKLNRGRPSLIKEAEFIKAFQDASSLVDVVKALPVLSSTNLGKAKLYVSMRAAALRKKGIKLKLFQRGRKPGLQSVRALNASAVYANNTEDFIDLGENVIIEPVTSASDQFAIKPNDSLDELINKLQGENDKLCKEFAQAQAAASE